MSVDKPQWVKDRERADEQMGPPPASGFVLGDTGRIVLVVLGIAAVIALGVAVTLIRAGMMYSIGRAVVG